MDILMLIAAFGGGVFGACIGGVTAFIFTGITVVAAILGGAAGAPMIPFVSFGSWFGPHISFCGAAAAGAYLMRRGKMESGADIITPLCKYNDGAALLVGGMFGVFGYLIEFVISDLFGVNVLNLAGWTDTVAITVFLNGLLTRLTLGTSGFFGKWEGEKHVFLPDKNRFTFLLVLGAGSSLLVGCITVALGQMGLDGSQEAMYLFNNMGSFAFGIAAICFLWLPMKLPMENLHQIILPAATTVLTVFAVTQNAVLSIIGGVIIGMIGAVLCDIAARTFNTNTDSHIDPPAFTIAVLQIFNFSILPMLLA